MYSELHPHIRVSDSRPKTAGNVLIELSRDENGYTEPLPVQSSRTKRNPYLLLIVLFFRDLGFCRRFVVEMTSVRFIFLAILVFSVCIVPASAMTPIFTYRGTVTDLDPAGETLSIEATHKWGCIFEEDFAICGWIEIDHREMRATVPVNEVFSYTHAGDTVEVTGNPNGSWQGIAKLVPTSEIDNWYATDLFGEPSTLRAPLDEGYELWYQTYTDCASCSDNACAAEEALVTISRSGQERWTGWLFPGEVHTYHDPGDLSRISVKFVSGETSSISCPDSDFNPFGPEPFSRFVVNVRPSDTGSLVVTSTPDGALTYVDGQYQGATPLFLTGIDPGVYTVLIEKEGYESWGTVVEVRSGRSSTTSARLVPLYGTLTVRSMPSGARIFLDGTAAGYTPTVFWGVLPGSHVVTFSKEGYYPADTTVQVSAGQISFAYKRLRAGDGAVAAM